MSLLGGLIGIAINIVPDLFRLITTDRENDLSDQIVEIVKDLVKTDDEAEASKKIEQDPVLKAELRKHLADLAYKATVEQNRAEEEQRRIDLEFLQQEFAEQEQIHQQQLKALEADLESTTAARDHASETAKSEHWLVSGTNSMLSLLITAGFFGALVLILKSRTLENTEVFFTAIGTLATAFATVIGFHFGSSSGSKRKDRLLQEEVRSAELNASGAVVVTEVDEVTGIPVPKPKPGAPRFSNAPDATAKQVDNGGTFDLFKIKAPGIMRSLINDFEVTEEQAGGVLGNVGLECAGFRHMQELKPSSGRGGWGWCQWTGPRRRAFESWCKDQGHTDLTSDDANYGFLKHELKTTEKRALEHLKKTETLSEATRSFMSKFERPGVEHFERRLKWAELALAEYDKQIG